MSTPGHHNQAAFIGDVAMLHYGHGGAITGVLLVVNIDGEPLHLAVMVRHVSQWPPGLAKGDRLWVTGVLRLHEKVWHRKNSHYLDVQHLERIRRWPRVHDTKGGDSHHGATPETRL